MDYIFPKKTNFLYRWSFLTVALVAPLLFMFSFYHSYLVKAYIQQFSCLSLLIALVLFYKPLFKIISIFIFVYSSFSLVQIMQGKYPLFFSASDLLLTEYPLNGFKAILCLSLFAFLLLAQKNKIIRGFVIFFSMVFLISFAVDFNKRPKNDYHILSAVLAPKYISTNSQPTLIKKNLSSENHIIHIDSFLQGSESSRLPLSFLGRYSNSNLREFPNIIDVLKANQFKVYWFMSKNSKSKDSYIEFLRSQAHQLIYLDKQQMRSFIQMLEGINTSRNVFIIESPSINGEALKNSLSDDTRFNSAVFSAGEALNKNDSDSVMSLITYLYDSEVKSISFPPDDFIYFYIDLLNLESPFFQDRKSPLKENYLKTTIFKRPFEDFPSTIGHHRLNSLEKLKNFNSKYPCLEIDLIFKEGELKVAHGVEDITELNLDMWLEKYTEGNNILWLDFKNFSSENHLHILKRLSELVKKYQLNPQNILIENGTVEIIKVFSEKGYQTAFFVPFKRSPDDFSHLSHWGEDVASKANLSKASAISFERAMYSNYKAYIEGHLSRNFDIYTWDNETWKKNLVYKNKNLFINEPRLKCILGE